MMKRAILLILLLATPLWSANDVSSDPNCVALWTFENGALLGEDSIGGNDLAINGTITQDTTPGSGGVGTPAEGSYCAEFVYPATPYMNRADADLDAGFPLKAGDTRKKISIVFWWWPGVFTLGDQMCLGKWNRTDNKRSLGVHRTGMGAPRRISLELGYNGGASVETISHTGLDVSSSTWLHIGVTYDDSNKSYRIRVYDLVTDTVAETTGTATNNINIEDAEWSIGRGLGDTVYGYGWYDEVVVFNRILTAAEIDEIRGGEYGSSGINDWWWRRRHSD